MSDFTTNRRNRVRISHVEVVQSIQSARNDPYRYVGPGLGCYGSPEYEGIPLITNKPTYARVYLHRVRVGAEVEINGKMRVYFQDTAGNSFSEELISEGFVTLKPRGNPSLMEQRLDWNQSLNFRIPGHVVAAVGLKEFRVVWLKTRAGDSISTNKQRIQLEFLREPKLICRAMLIRYRDGENDTYLEPSREEVDAIRDFVERCYPVARLEWSVVRVQADRDFFPLHQVQRYEREFDEASTKMLANLLRQIMAIRNQDLMTHPNFDAGTPAVPGLSDKTMYLGIISDPRGRFGGVAQDSPNVPTTHAVAACSTDASGQTGAHELAHILGRHHPGVPDLEVHGRQIGQYVVDSDARAGIGKYGYLSNKTNPEDIHLGLDIGSSLGRHPVPRVLDHRRNFDLLSYRWPQWLSAYSYREIFLRLKCIEQASFECPEDVKCWTVICSYDLERKDGRILHVLPTRYKTIQFPPDFESLDNFLAMKNAESLIWNGLQGMFPEKLWKAMTDILKNYDFEFLLKRDRKPEYSHSKFVFDISRYNNMMKDLVALDTTVKGLLENLNLQVELDEPEVRLYTNHALFDGACGDDGGGNPCAGNPGNQICPEESWEYMWENAEKINYRRAGALDRFSFGLCQATVHGNPQDPGAPPKSISLMIDGVVVDKFAQPPLDGILVDGDLPGGTEQISLPEKLAAGLFGSLEQNFNDEDEGGTLPGGESSPDVALDSPCGEIERDPAYCATRPSAHYTLVYDIAKDAYFLNFHWPMSVVNCKTKWESKTTPTITTTVQCWRKGCPYDDTLGDAWETVAVTDELNGSIWISPDLLDRKDQDQCNPQRPSAKKYYPNIAERRDHVLKFRFIVTAGFIQVTSREYEWKPQLVKPRRERKVNPFDSEKKCPTTCSYDDGYDSYLEQSSS